MEQQNPEQKSDFMRETIKGRPISKRKLFKSTITTLFLALLFGLVAGCTFLFLQPFLTNMIQGQKEPETQHITFPEDPVEMEPEEMLAENLEEEGEDIMEVVFHEFRHYWQHYYYGDLFTWWTRCSGGLFKK